MIRLICAVMAAGTVLLLQGCASHCRGESCTRSESSAQALVIWWHPHMRIETGVNTQPSDHQVVSLER